MFISRPPDAEDVNEMMSRCLLSIVIEGRQ